MKYTVTTLEKIEKMLQETGYVVRYERGNFQSGYCILEEKKVLVLNKFLTLEGRINTLIDILPQLNFDPESCYRKAGRFWKICSNPRADQWFSIIFARGISFSKNQFSWFGHQQRRSDDCLPLSGLPFFR